MRTLLPCLGLAALLAGTSAVAADIPRTPAPEGAKVYFIEPVDGATVDKTFTVKFGLKGMGVAPAGVDSPATGHHHLLIDLKEQPVMNLPLPMTDQIKHFGKGQTETQVTLPPGKHTLQLLVGDKNHVPFDPPVESQQITVNVK
ncbi:MULTISPECIES: DUF4399 domain-containing protein [Pseudomonas]|uniref:DUF4399 domain-containing protein n=1 Tax=Pseudomonas nitroreducens TaxID=46680 RepID=A0A6G6J520_PSENT|nr:MULTISPECIES: DUF4399 domain-containing protein [Pseudomonas]MBG6286205.1 DUF4399 domain-containing protein [Pseudomonas nitroreducens]MCJ1880766.1 DUF4399 domain-containing protein [Pseudomonas nitroreducens]MCJ1895716.1 DUF4399 domain-containing protein [Pseudomonas nitroreducens]MDG9856750.1 DUF4399 domain-containing protein [Pseudomonas nitroreducens]NMZ60834.1 DUF4399 domain-containing protein [Pseudomonas nitroreducens]